MEQQQLFVDMALQAWHTQINRAGKLFNALTDDELLKEVAPGKNKIIYIMGHLVAYHDLMAETMGIGKRAYQHLDNDFLINPDKPQLKRYTADDLKDSWHDVHQKLNQYFSELSPDDWFKKHNAVSDEEFAKQPTRNRLNLLMNRTGHVAYHVGQVRLAYKH